ncbi:hypothetical protein [Microbulbifer epialgicus]|uniref:Uncharacterized protein n=1 Tax=Microbulbifer epialgicus TaxID=393907 RepID=A0ABV4NZR0_9GAMM
MVQHIEQPDYTITGLTIMDRPAQDMDFELAKEFTEAKKRDDKERIAQIAKQYVAHILFRHLVQATPGLDLFSRLRLRGEISIDRNTVTAELSEAHDRLVALQERGVVREDSPADLLDRALAFWNGYHNSTAAKADGDEITITDPSLILYYQNRLVDFAEAIADPDQMPAAREIAHLGLLA